MRVKVVFDILNLETNRVRKEIPLTRQQRNSSMSIPRKWWSSMLAVTQFCIAHPYCARYSRNRPRSIYQYSSTAPRLSGQNCKFFKFLLSLNSQKRLGYKENNTKYRILTRKPRSHARILIYRTWAIRKECCSVVSSRFFGGSVAWHPKKRLRRRL